MKKTAAILATVALALTACTGNEESEQAGSNLRDEQRANNISLDRMADSQPIPSFDWSQERQTLLDTLALRAQGAQTTTLFTITGVGIIAWCPSIGAPVPSTFQSTAGQQYVDISGDATRQNFPVDQMEPTGIYPGDTDATWTLCLDDNGKKFGVYWEAPVSSITGTIDASALGDDVVRLAPSDLTFEFTEQE